MHAGLLLLALLPAVLGDQWAVLVAGSNGYWNYRHQSDICHAYQVLISHGVPATNIILMTYNDVASSSSNPFPNTLFNKPGNNVQDVNAGCVKDYTGADVTPQNFISVITGNAAAVKRAGNGRVLQSGPNDNVFINFVDHGGVGLIAFPSSYLYANTFISALNTMSQKQLYGKLTIYIEACESGSMFNNLLPNNTEIYGVTASNPSESSWATYCSPQDVVNGKEIGSCLGDLFSVNWMENSESSNLNNETLSKQFDIVAALTTQSQVCKYGDFDFITEEVGDFLGNATNKTMSANSSAHVHYDSRDVKLHYLMNLYKRDSTWQTADDLMAEIIDRQRHDELMSSFASHVQPHAAEHLMKAAPEKINFECLEGSVVAFETYCHKLSDYGLKYVRTLANACNTGITVEEVETFFNSQCKWKVETA
jgi:legumain